MAATKSFSRPLNLVLKSTYTAICFFVVVGVKIELLRSSFFLNNEWIKVHNVVPSFLQIAVMYVRVFCHHGIGEKPTEMPFVSFFDAFF